MAEAERALIAAKDGDLQTLRSLRRSVSIATDGFGATALHYAARTGQMECVKWLVEAIGISPNVRGTSGATPLHDAAAQGQLECVKYFLENGVEVETRDRSGHTALHLAARFGRFEMVKWLTEKGNCNARVKSRNHMSPLHFAASGGHLTCLQLLVFKAGYSCVNDVATDGTTPLYLASQDGNLDCLKYLHSVGGKCDAKARDGMLPIHGAAQNGHLDCLGYLIESGQADLNERDSKGATPAHYAAAQGHVNVLKWLNAKGDISSVDALGGSPLHDAAEQGQFECIRYLVENIDLDVNQTDNEGLTPLALAEKSGHRKCIDYLKIATSRQAKAQKRQVETNKQRVEQDSNKFASFLTTPNGEKPALKKSSSGERESYEEAPKQNVTANNTARKHSDSNSESKAEKCKAKTKREFLPKNPDTKESSVARGESPKQSSKLHTAAVSNSNGNDSGGKKEGNINAQAKQHKKKSDQQSPSTEQSNVTESMGRVKPLRERQLQPLPHFGESGGSPEQTSRHQPAANNSSSSGSKDGKINAQAKRESPEKPALKGSLLAQRESPKQASKHHTASDKHNKSYNSNVEVKGNGNSKNNKKGEPVKENTANTASSSSLTAPQDPSTEESLLGTSDPPAERVKPLRERQLQPLPHFGDIAPPTPEFSDYSDSSDVKDNKLQPLYENAELDGNIHTGGLFKQSRHNQRVRFEEENCRVIVEVQSLETNGGFWRTRDKFENVQAKAVRPEAQSKSPMKNELCGDTSHVTSTGRFHRGVDETVSAEFGSELPPWKKQILVNRNLKEKAQERADREKVLAFGSELPPWKKQILVNRNLKEKAQERADREKREIEERKWIGVPPWKIPLLAKQEKERLKEEQRWVNMPEWKKNLLSRREARQSYGKYHA